MSTKTTLSMLGLCLLAAGCNANQAAFNNPFIQKEKPAAVYKGTWENSGGSTVQVVKNEPLTVKYCFKDTCNDHLAAGTQTAFTITFPPANEFKGASLQMTQLGDEYHAVYQNVGFEESFRTIYRK